MSINYYLLNANEEKRLLLRARNKWMIRIRWYYLVLLTGIAVASNSFVGADQAATKKYLILGAVGLACNFILWMATMPKKPGPWYYKTVALLQVALDIVLASLVIESQGGLDSRAIVLYAIPILVSGVLFLGLAAYVAAGMSSLAYGLTLWSSSVENATGHTTEGLIVPIIFYSSVFFVLAAIVSRFSLVNIINERERSYSELLAMLRHQLRHPSGVIAAIVEMLESSSSYAALPQKDRWYIQQLKHENLRLNTMVTNLLAAAEESKERMHEKSEKINLIKLIEETALSCATSAKRLDDLKVDYPVEALHVRGRSDQLTAAFDNIIDNSFRYSQPGTAVTITINKHKPQLEIAVADSGKGMSKDQQSQLSHHFIKLEEGKDAPQLYSTGLGLYVSRIIIERHGGTMKLESTKGKGTKVNISLNEAKYEK